MFWSWREKSLLGGLAPLWRHINFWSYILLSGCHNIQLLIEHSAHQSAFKRCQWRFTICLCRLDPSKQPFARFQHIISPFFLILEQLESPSLAADA